LQEVTLNWQDACHAIGGVVVLLLLLTGTARAAEARLDCDCTFQLSPHLTSVFGNETSKTVLEHTTDVSPGPAGTMILISRSSAERSHPPLPPDVFCAVGE